MTTSPLTRSSLLIRIRDHHDNTAWSEFVEIYAPLIHRFGIRRGLQDADAADIGQEVFRTVATRIGSFQHGRSGDTFRGWLRTITRNKVGDFLRRWRNAAQR